MFRQRALAQLKSRRASFGAASVVVGFDGFVDTIVTPVGLRRGAGEDFTPIATLAELGHRITAAAGKSTNIELYPRLDKLGGNGPIMANALLSAGARVTYIGALGVPAVHPVFAEMAARARTVSICAAAQTTAIECGDGKLMLGQMRCLDEITYDRICAVMGEAAFHAEVASASMVAFLDSVALGGEVTRSRRRADHGPGGTQDRRDRDRDGERAELLVQANGLEVFDLLSCSHARDERALFVGSGDHDSPRQQTDGRVDRRLFDPRTRFSRAKDPRTEPREAPRHRCHSRAVRQCVDCTHRNHRSQRYLASAGDLFLKRHHRNAAEIGRGREGAFRPVRLP